jgi:nicotinamidase/pyrazinamidase
MKTALIVSDLQHDLVLGALPVAQARLIIPRVNRLIKHYRSLKLPVIYTKKWHLPNNQLFDEKKFPLHCIQESPGAEFYKDLLPPLDTEKVIHKGTHPDSPGISAFGGDVRALVQLDDGTSQYESLYGEDATSTTLEKYLHDLKVQGIVLVGLMFDYQLTQTAIDARTRGFEAAIVTNATISSRTEPGFEIHTAIEAYKNGVKFIKDETKTKEEILK